MNNKIKIKISETAYSKLQIMLNNQYEYSSLRFTYKDGCCKSPKVDISLDNIRENDYTDNIETLPIIYDNDVVERINEIILVYRNKTFMIKTVLNDLYTKNCANCKSNCNKNYCKEN